MNVNNNLSSIYANQQLLNSSAHNIANSNTQNFQRLETTISEDTLNTPVATNQQIENEMPYSNTDLTKEMTNQIISYHAVGANAVAVETQSQTDKTILDMYA